MDGIRHTRPVNYQTWCITGRERGPPLVKIQQTASCSMLQERRDNSLTRTTKTAASCDLIQERRDNSILLNTNKVIIATELTKEIIPLQTKPGSEIYVVRQLLEQNQRPTQATIDLGSYELKRLCNMFDLLAIKDNRLQAKLSVNNRYIWCTVCPKEMRPLVIQKGHTQHHSGVNRTYKRLRLNWFWPGMAADVRRSVRACEICQAAKNSTPKASNDQQRLHAGRPWQVLALDLVGPLTETDRGNTMILVIADHFTRWKDAIPIPDGTTKSVIDALEKQVFCYFGLPERIHSDRGSQFESQLTHELCNIWGIKKSKTTSYHPQGNGIVERGNKDLGDALRALLLNRDETEWDLVLPQLMRSLRAMPNTTTGETPNYLMFGRELHLPDTLISGVPTQPKPKQQYAIELQEILETAYEKLRNQQQETRTMDTQEPPLYEKGNLVWLKSKRYKKGKTSKLQPKYVGPFKIMEVFSNHTYSIKKNEKESVEHESRLKPHFAAKDSWGRAPNTQEPARHPTKQGISNRKRKSSEQEATGNSPVKINNKTAERESESNISEPEPTENCEDENESTLGMDNRDEPNVNEDPTRYPKRLRKTPSRYRNFVVNYIQLSKQKFDKIKVPLTGPANRKFSSINQMESAKSLHSNLSCLNNHCSIKHSTTLNTMASNYIDQGAIDLHTDSDLSAEEDKDQGQPLPLPVTTSTTTQDIKDVNKRIFISEDTASKIRRLHRAIKDTFACTRCNKPLSKGEPMRTHAWSHYILFVCEICYHTASRADTLHNHHKQRHSGQECRILQTDYDNYEKAKQYVPLPKNMPPLPLVKSPTVTRKRVRLPDINTCLAVATPPSKEALTPIKTPPKNKAPIQVNKLAQIENRVKERKQHVPPAEKQQPYIPEHRNQGRQNEYSKRIYQPSSTPVVPRGHPLVELLPTEQLEHHNALPEAYNNRHDQYSRTSNRRRPFTFVEMEKLDELKKDTAEVTTLLANSRKMTRYLEDRLDHIQQERTALEDRFY